jgi:hypothetical protein
LEVLVVVEAVFMDGSFLSLRAAEWKMLWRSIDVFGQP